MKLAEFYGLNEARTAHYTIEPDGSLLAWERRSFLEDDIDDDFSYEMLSSREEDSFRKIRDLLGLSREEIEQARDLWTQAASEGESLFVSKDGDRLNLDIQLRADPENEGSEDPLSTMSRYKKDNSNNYF